MRIVVLEPAGLPEIREIRGPEQLGEVLGGYLEVVSSVVIPGMPKRAVLLVDEEGLLKGLAPNLPLRVPDPVVWLCGRILVAAAGEEDFEGLTEEEAERAARALKREIDCVKREEEA